jgi:hypothetical protein
MGQAGDEGSEFIDGRNTGDSPEPWQELGELLRILLLQTGSDGHYQKQRSVTANF